MRLLQKDQEKHEVLCIEQARLSELDYMASFQNLILNDMKRDNKIKPPIWRLYFI
jgi:hypothetical protein